ncbi:hypothetical protein H8D85_01860 [bacterium]|nr:hypothetical protein [bacterium]
MKDKFNKDLEYGRDGEMVIGLYLSMQGMQIIEGVSKDFYNPDYDLLMYSPKHDKNLKFEVKTDNYVSDELDTGNIAIEIMYKGKSSGLSSTKSDWWVYYMPNISSNNVWMMQVDKLRDLIKKNIKRLKVVMGGDDNQSKLVLIPRKEYSRYFGIDTIKKKDIEDE